MKRIISILLTAVFLFICIPVVYAQSGIDFSLKCGNVDNNRLFMLNVYAKGQCSNLASFKITFTYDRNYIEYRKAVTSDKSSVVKANDNGNTAAVVFLNTNGVNVNSQIELFGIQFKSIKSGSTTVHMQCEQLIDSDANDLNVLTVEQINIEINGKTIKTSTVKKSVNKNNSSSKNKTKATNNADNDQNEEVFTDENGNIIASGSQNQGNHGGFLDARLNDNSLMTFLAGAGSIIVIGGVFAAAFYLGRKSKKSDKKADDEKNDE